MRVRGVVSCSGMKGISLDRRQRDSLPSCLVLRDGADAPPQDEARLAINRPHAEERARASVSKHGGDGRRQAALATTTSRRRQITGVWSEARSEEHTSELQSLMR